MLGTKLSTKDLNQHSRDDRFLQELEHAINANITNDQFGVEQLAEIMAMSRTQLYRRLHRLSGKNVSQFIREYRLNKAMELLKKNVASAAEIAYQMGFSSPSYFNKCFHDQYGITPGEVLKNHIGEKELLIQRNENDKKDKSIYYHTSRQKIRTYRLSKYLLLALSSIILVALTAGYFIKLYQQTTSAKSAPWNFIAVLPFRNDSPDLNNDYICNGIMDEISNRLGKVSSLHIMSRQSVEKYRDSDKDISTIANELGVANLITGSVRKAGDSISVNIQLVEANNGNILWSEIYHDRYNEKIYEFESNVAKQIAYILNISITPKEEHSIDRKLKTEFQAYDYILRAMDIHRKFWGTHNSDYSTTLQYLTDKALEIDPESSLVNAWKGAAFATEGWYAKRSLRIEKFDSALFYADKALALDPENAMAYNLKANVYCRLDNKDDAKSSFIKAIELLPNDPTINEAFGRNLTTWREKKDFVKGMTYRRKAIRFGNIKYDATVYQLGAYYDLLGEYTKAKMYLLESMKLGYENPSYNHYSSLLIRYQKPGDAVHFLDSVNFEDYDRSYHGRSFWACIEMNELEEAENHYNKFMNYGGQLPDFYGILLGHLYIKTNRKAEAISVLDPLREKSEKVLSGGKSYWDLYQLFEIHALLDEPKQALKYLAEMERSFLLMNSVKFINSSILYQNVRNDPKFKAIIQRAEAENEAVKAQIIEMEKQEGFDF